jgi:hypothetical protein
MMTVGLAAFALVDREQVAATGERQREVSFNLAEQLLNAQVYKLSRDWPGPGHAADPYPDCTTGVTNSRCPDAASILSRFGGVDLAAGATWSTIVRDNNSPNLNYYDDAITNAEPHYDANHDDRVWVRSQAIVHGTRRTLIGLVRVTTQLEQFPQSVLLAGKFGTTNSGKKVIVGTGGAPLQVRCLTRTPACLDYSVAKGQVSPDTSQVGYTGGNAMSDDQIDRLRQRAVSEGTYYTGCPTRPQGALVFIEEGNCTYGNESMPCCNSAASPGVVIINRGTLGFDGNVVFNGLVYAPNRNNSSDWVVSTAGNSMIIGAVSIDGPGGMLMGSSSTNLKFVANIFNLLVSYPSAGIVQNTWREIPT